LGVILASASSVAAADHAYIVERTTLEINGERPAVSGVSGGGAVGIVSAETSGNGTGLDKRISGVRYEEIVFTVSPSQIPKSVVDALNGKSAPIDFNYKSIRRLEFQDAVSAGYASPNWTARARLRRGWRSGSRRS
jgi:hypothetical protein